MPIKSVTTTPAPGFLIQDCVVCGTENKISFGRGAQKSKPGPFALQNGDTLDVTVDVGLPQTVTFAAGDFPDFAAVTAAQLAAKLIAALSGITASDDAGGCLIESSSTGASSKVEITGGTVRAALGFPTDGRKDPSPGRPVLGVAFGPAGDQMKNKNVIALRRCNGCGANECLIRTFDVAPGTLNGTHFAEHRKTVNSLAEHFKGQGWSHPDVANDHAAEVGGPPELDPALPPGPSNPPPRQPPATPPGNPPGGP